MNLTLNIILRDVDASVVGQIDEMARKKGVSRNQFLKVYLSNLSILSDLRDMQARYDETLDKVLLVITENTKAFLEFNANLEKKR